MSWIARLAYAVQLQQVEHVAQIVQEGQRLNCPGIQKSDLLLLQILQLEHGLYMFTIQIHSVLSVLYANTVHM